jgi:predicted Zn-dependent peptidase
MSVPNPAGPVRRVLPSGLVLLHERMPHRASISVGVWLKAGARDEPIEHAGMTHFLEHMLFKGTARRNAYQISAALESVGGHLDAYTAREHVCYSARAIDRHLERALDVLSDIVLDSTLPAEEVAREKEVVREEIGSYEDAPEDKVHEVLAEALWGDDPLGRPILGSEQSVAAYAPDTLRAFYRERYHPGTLVVSVAGAFDPDALEDMVARAFDRAPGAPIELVTSNGSTPPRSRYVARDVSQLHLALGRPGLSHGDEDRYRFAVLNTIAGGGMSSRFFQTLREQRGLAYSVYTTSESYRDTGMLTIALGVKPERGGEALEALRAELGRFAAEGPTTEELEGGKAQIRGALLLGEESVSNHMAHLALDEIAYGRYIPLDEHLEAVDAVTGSEVMDLARQFYAPEGWTLAAVGPESGSIEREVRGKL